MYSGSLDRESVTSVLRGLSQKRRQGVLEVRIDSGETLLISFVNGRIVAASRVDEPAATGVLRRLTEGGYLSDTTQQKLLESNLNLEELQKLLLDNRAVSKEHFLRAKRAYEVDILHMLRLSKGEYEFQARIVKIDSEMSLALSPGQLLLDFVEVESEGSRFEEIFGAESGEELFIEKLNTDAGRVSEAERCVLENITTAQEGLSAIAKASLLSQYSLREALLSLYDRELIDIFEYEDKPNMPGESTGSIDDLPESISEAVNTDEDRVLQESSNPAPSLDAAADLLSVVGESSARKFRDEVAEEANAEETKEIEQISAVNEDSVFSGIDDLLQNDKDAKQEFLENNGKDKAELGYKSGNLQIFCAESQYGKYYERVLALNYRLLEAQAHGKVGVIVTSIFLIGLAISAPAMFQDWFHALKAFSI